MKRALILAAVWGFAAAAWAQAFPPMDAALAKELDADVRALLPPAPSGLSIGVLHQGKAWLSAYGLLNVEKKLKATPLTSYRMASVTKCFTAVAVMQLVEKNKLSLDADVRTYVPRFPEKPWPVTVRQLLSHLGGVSHYRGLPGEERITRHLSTEQALDVFKDWDLVAEPGTRYVYSSYGYDLLAAAVESASGMDFGTYLRESVFAPAGMTRSALENPKERDASWAKGYVLAEGKLGPSSVIDISSRLGGGGTRGTVEDLLRFAAALQSGALVSAETFKQMTMAQATRDGTLTDYGFGFGVFPQRGHFVVSHMGSQPETSTLFVYLPAEDLALALATNLEDQAASLSAISNAVIERVLDKGLRRRPVVSDNEEDARFLEAASRIASYGLAEWDAERFRGEPPSEDPPPFDEAEKLFGSFKSIAEGHQPKLGAPFVKVGLAMARTLAKELGEEALADARRAGALAFFQAYGRAGGEGWSEETRTRVGRLADEYARSKSPELAKVRFARLPSAKAVLSELKAFPTQGARVDLSPELSALALKWALAGRGEEATKVAERNAQLYPSSAEAQIGAAEVFAVLGEKDTGKAAFCRAEGGAAKHRLRSLKSLAKAPAWTLFQSWIAEKCP